MYRNGVSRKANLRINEIGSDSDWHTLRTDKQERKIGSCMGGLGDMRPICNLNTAIKEYQESANVKSVNFAGKITDNVVQTNLKELGRIRSKLSGLGRWTDPWATRVPPSSPPPHLSV